MKIYITAFTENKISERDLKKYHYLRIPGVGRIQISKQQMMRIKLSQNIHKNLYK